MSASHASVIRVERELVLLQFTRVLEVEHCVRYVALTAYRHTSSLRSGTATPHRSTKSPADKLGAFMPTKTVL